MKNFVDVATRDEQLTAELIEIIDRGGSNERTFRDIIRWSKGLSSLGTTFNPPNVGLQENITHFMNVMRSCNVILPEPKEKIVKTQGVKDGEEVIIDTPVSYFEFNQQLLSLISDAELWKAENLVVNADDPFGGPPTREYGNPFESHHAQRYRDILVTLHDSGFQQNSEVLLPIIL